MRLKLCLKPIGNCILPINYQYEISSWFYNVIGSGDYEFGEWLHNEGYTPDGKRKYKLFTFSNIYIKNKEVLVDRIHIHDSQVELVMSFYMESAAKSLLVGLFNNKKIEIADSFSKAEFLVEKIIPLPEPEFSDKMYFRALSPICISRQTNRATASYLSPEDPEYTELFLHGLLYKYLAVDPNYIITIPPKLNPFGKVISKLIKIKANTKKETWVRGFLYDFELVADPKLIRFGYYCGFGEKNSMGFGFTRIK